MNLREVTETLTVGGKAFVTASSLGLAGLGLYSFMVNDHVIYLAAAITAVEAGAVFVGGYYGGFSAKSVGWIHGGMVGIFALILMILFKAFVFGAAPSMNESGLAAAAGTMVLGSLGGITGINFRHLKQSRVRHRYLGS